MRTLVPQRRLYIYYPTAGAPHRNVIASWPDWCWDYGDMRTISDMPNNSIYYMHANDGFTGDMDMLSLMLNSIGENYTYGEYLSYNWVNGGWTAPDRPPMADPDRYEGYLKCCYMTGMIGAAALYGGTDDPLNWIWQFQRLGKVHAMYSWLEPFVRASDLLPGPNRHRWNRLHPAYEFPTGDATARVLARKHHDRDDWLIAAWAADGAARNVTVTIPILGTVIVEARPDTAIYRARLKQNQPYLYEYNIASCSAPMMDSNGDAHVDSIDFDAFSACYNGPTNLIDGNCQCIDSNGDEHIDAIDFDAFSACYNGPVNPPGCS